MSIYELSSAVGGLKIFHDKVYAEQKNDIHTDDVETCDCYLASARRKLHEKIDNELRIIEGK